MGEERILKTSGYFSLGHICLRQLQRRGKDLKGDTGLPLIASAVLKISRLGVYRTTDPKHAINSIVWSEKMQLVAYRIFHDSASHLNEDRRDMHGEEHTVEISAPKTDQDTLRRDGISSNKRWSQSSSRYRIRPQ